MLIAYCYGNIFLSFIIRTMGIYSLPHLIFYIQSNNNNNNNNNNKNNNNNNKKQKQQEQ